MTSPKISIIVPVYKAESPIRKCLDSIISQTFIDWECILVDDGSPDSSGAICDEYAANDCRFRVIHKQNGGVSAARQTGLDAVKGEYVIHADPDDWVEPPMLEDLYAKAKEDDADMVICDFYTDIAGTNRLDKQDITSLYSEDLLNDMFIGNIHGSCCNKLVRKAIIDRCHACFPEGVNYCEDVSFNVQLFQYGVKAIYLNQAYYHYVQVETSITNKFSVKTFESQKKYIEFLCTRFPSDSEIVLRTKEFVKKYAFRSGALSNEHFRNLYPEITHTQENNRLMRIMFNAAFQGKFWIANPLRSIYLLIHNKK